MRFSKYEPQAVSEAFNEMEPVTEGWGIAVWRLMTLWCLAYGLVQAAVFHKSIEVIRREFSKKDVIDAFKKSDLLCKHVKSECDRIYKEYKKGDSSVTSKLPGGFWNEIAKGSVANSPDFSPLRSFVTWGTSISNGTAVSQKIGDYEIFVEWDTDEIFAIYVILYSEKNKVFIKNKINPPQESVLYKI